MTAKTDSRNPSQKKVKPMTPQRLYNIAVYYLERYASSKANLARVLERRTMKTAAKLDEGFHITPQQQQDIQDVVEKLSKQGFLDDDRYAEQQVRSLWRRGKSLSVIRQTLKAKGVDIDTIETGITQLVDETDGTLDILSAKKIAKKKKLGCYGSDESHEKYQKDLSVLARYGFSYDVAKAVLKGEEDDA